MRDASGNLVVRVRAVGAPPINSDGTNAPSKTPNDEGAG
jgi:hypothetical protein